MALAPMITVLALAGWGASDATAQAKPEKVVIGYQDIPNEEIIAKQLGWHEKELGVKIDWKKFDSGRDVNTAIAAGSVDVGLVGSSPAAAGLSTGVPYEVIWIYDVIAENEALVIKKGKGISKFTDLAGKKVAAPFGSTTHDHLLVAFKVFGLDPKKATILDMQPPDMLAAWQRGDIDAGFVWEPTLIKMVESGGEILVKSKELADKGYITADVAVARKGFSEKYPQLVSTYLANLSKAVDYFSSEPGRGGEAPGQGVQPAGGGDGPADEDDGDAERQGAARRQVPRHVPEARRPGQGAQGHGRLPQGREADQGSADARRVREGGQPLLP